MEAIMKKVFFFAAAALILNISVFAQEYEPEQEPVPPQQTQTPTQTAPEQKTEDSPYELHLTFINAGGGMHIPLAGYGFVELLRFGAEHKKSGLGAEFTPFHIYGWVGGPSGGNTQNNNNNNNGGDGDDDDGPGATLGGGVSILNLTVYWNLVGIFGGEDTFFLAPFASMNYAIMHQEFAPDEFMFSAGLQAGIRRGSKVKFTVFAVETGLCVIKNYRGYFPNSDGPRFFAIIKAGR